MAGKNQQVGRDSFTSRFGVVAAAAGSAIGLGNIWRFPYVAGENGGGAFLLLYLLIILAIGVPVMMSEFLIGRKAQLNVFGAFRSLAPGKLWSYIGILGVGVAFMILSFYGVVAGWALDYTLYALRDGFEGKTTLELKAMFENLSGGTARPIVLMLIFMILTALIVRSGIQKGIERYTKFMMPLLLGILVVLAISSVSLQGATEGLKFFFRPDFSAINAHTIVAALGQAFFSLSLGMGVMATYGSYIKKSESIGKTAISVSMADTIVAVLAGIVIFPAVFAFGIEPGVGPGLVFVTLPGIFNQMAGGYYLAIVFFILLAIAALTSSISLLEVVVAYFVEELKMTRTVATWIATAIISGLGVLCVLSQTLFNFFDNTSSNVLLPLGGFLMIIFVGWVLGKKVVKAELEADGRPAFYLNFLLPVIRFVAPIAIALVFLNRLGLLAA